ncbi:hypothetical protein D8674_018809 [Pyrus ussuriensis x Pyrus communis]|uniref:Uncharacterized protein n=1 Tax=Pyrus ussuriensis x Pyrus communis TaxID=2448454 RepID=A0A5N5G6H4_9ROSA|nr:hypothetical protein D8674_018809 [Pyrus ussuriensis x Pyrus communis]
MWRKPSMNSLTPSLLNVLQILLPNPSSEILIILLVRVARRTELNKVLHVRRSFQFSR